MCLCVNTKNTQYKHTHAHRRSPEMLGALQSDHQQQLSLLAYCFSVDRGWHTQTHILSLSQTCSFCVSASPALQRKPWPRFQARLVAMAKLSSEYYGLSLSPTWNWDSNYTCVYVCECVSVCACFHLRSAFSLSCAGNGAVCLLLENPGLNIECASFSSYHFLRMK